MSESRSKNDRLIARFKPFIVRSGGGIFTRKTRERLVGIKGLSGRDRTKNDFWYDVRNRVKTALKDLELFVEAASRDHVNQAINKESLEPVVSTLLWGPDLHDPSPDPIRAEIADILILWGFRYFQQKACMHAKPE